MIGFFFSLTLQVHQRSPNVLFHDIFTWDPGWGSSLIMERKQHSRTTKRHPNLLLVPVVSKCISLVKQVLSLSTQRHIIFLQEGMHRIIWLGLKSVGQTYMIQPQGHLAMSDVAWGERCNPPQRGERILWLIMQTILFHHFSQATWYQFYACVLAIVCFNWSTGF